MKMHSKAMAGMGAAILIALALTEADITIHHLVNGFVSLVLVLAILRACVGRGEGDW